MILLVILLSFLAAYPCLSQDVATVTTPTGEQLRMRLPVEGKTRDLIVHGEVYVVDHEGNVSKKVKKSPMPQNVRTLRMTPQPLKKATDKPAALLDVQTNKYLVSNIVDKRRWSRTALMADKDDRPLDPTGQLVAAADAAAVDELARDVGTISDGAEEAAMDAASRILQETNNVPENAIHFGISIPRQNMENLSAMVVDEGTDGTNDWQVVRFPSLLAVSPNRKVRYSAAGVTNMVNCTWDRPWSTNSFDHRCTIKRPQNLVGANVTFHTHRHDTIGGASGFSFGSALVRVDGDFAFTGAVTNKVDGTILYFNSGVFSREE